MAAVGSSTTERMVDCPAPVTHPLDSRDMWDDEDKPNVDALKDHFFAEGTFCSHTPLHTHTHPFAPPCSFPNTTSVFFSHYLPLIFLAPLPTTPRFIYTPSTPSLHTLHTPFFTHTYTHFLPPLPTLPPPPLPTPHPPSTPHTFSPSNLQPPTSNFKPNTPSQPNTTTTLTYTHTHTYRKTAQARRDEADWEGCRVVAERAKPAAGCSTCDCVWGRAWAVL